MGEDFRRYSENNGAGENGQAGESGSGGEASPGFLELVYGVLFDPDQTMAGVALNPPLVPALLVVTITGIIGSLMGFLTASRVMVPGLSSMVAGDYFPLRAVQSLAVLGAVCGLLWSYVKWFGYSAVIHLAADLFGGKGRARGVFAVVGLAGLPFIFMIPVQLLAYWFGTGKFAVGLLVLLAGLGLLIWNVIILVTGLKHVHGFTTGRSVLVIATPFLVFLVLALLTVAGIAVVVTSLTAGMRLPGYF